jgi:hypothetical protein
MRSIWPGENNSSRADLAGNIDAFGLFPVLQFLEGARASGMLSVQGKDGAGTLIMVDGKIAGGEFGRLRHQEANIALLCVKRGRFLFESRGMALATIDSTSVTMLLLEVARLEDELEVRAHSLPERDVRVSLLEPTKDQLDPLETGVSRVVELLRTQGKVSLGELEEQLDLAPIKVQLALASLAATQAIRERPSHLSLPSIASLGDAPPWYITFLTQYAGGARLVLAYSAFGSMDALEATLINLAQAMEAPAPKIPALGAEVAMLRLRSRFSGLLSLTLLPLRRQHRAHFVEAVPSADIVLLSADAFGEELRSWEAFARKTSKAKVQMIPANDERPDWLVRALAAALQSSASGPMSVGPGAGI